MLLKIALIGMAVLFVVTLRIVWPTRLEVNLDQPISEYRAQSGPHRVVFRLLRETTTGDNGLVQIEVLVNGQQVKTLAASFSYDTLTLQPAGQFRWLWLDGDVWPDVQLEPNSVGEAQAFYIGSRDGGFYARSAR